ncbi:MAG: hypothetical protein EBU22_03970 [Actinobacteria bacterium]|nr:hypothetical protein [Actinomycetota bacterium]NBQ04442.1 hypothetical protein [Actinomycetota bacterium]
MKSRAKFLSCFFASSLAFGLIIAALGNEQKVDAAIADFSTPEFTEVIGSTRDETLIDLDQNTSGSFAIVGTTDGEIDGNPNRQLDAFVAKFNVEGKRQWLVRFGTPQDDYATAVAIDESGTVWVSGDTYGGMEGNVNKGERDGFVAKFSSTGVQQWIVHISTDVIERARGLAVDARGVATVVGTTYGEFPGFSNFGKSREAWITQIDASGNRLWLQQFGSEYADTIVDVVVDNAGNSTFCGYTDGAIGVKSYGGRDSFVGSFSTSGLQRWMYQFGTFGTDICYGVAVNSQNEIIAVGSTSETVDGAVSRGKQDAFVLKLTSTGLYQWASQFGSSGDDGLAKIATNSAGQIIVGGSTTGSFDTTPNLGSLDAFLLVIDANGKSLSFKQFGSERADGVAGIAVDGAQKVVIAGTIGSGIFGKPGIGELDVFISKFPALNAAPAEVVQRTVKCKRLNVVKTFTGPKAVCPAGYKRLKN